MSDFSTAVVQTWCVGICAFLSILSSLFLYDRNGALYRLKPWLKRLITIACLTFFAWGPWATFVLWILCQKSMNGIDYLQRPDDVLPRDRQVIDLNRQPLER